MNETIMKYVIPTLITTGGFIFVGLIPYLKQRKAKKRTLLNGWEMHKTKNERIKKSMDFCEDKITEIEISMKDKFSELLESKNIDTKTKSEEMRIYSNCIEKALHIRNRCFLHDVRENHFHLRGQKEHDEYVKQKIDAHLSGVTKELNDMYFSSNITREELYRFSTPLLEEISDILRDVYDFAYDCSLEAIERAKKILDYENVTDISEREWWIDKI